MNSERHTPFSALLAAELTAVAVAAGSGLWIAQDVVVRALRFVVFGDAG